MKKVKMLKDDRGSQTGSVVEEFAKGKEYNVSDELALNFMSTGSAAIIGDGDEPAEKDAGNVEQNKDAGASIENKSDRKGGKRSK